MRKTLLLLTAVWAFIGQSLTLKQTPIQQLLSERALQGALVGVFVQTADKQPQTLCALNEATRFMPASNAKLFTSALALEKLGEEFTFSTPLLTDGQVEEDILKGNLYIKGSGDPSLTRERLKELATALASKGIKFVKGDIVVDVSAFTENRWGVGWSWDYLHFGYAPEIWAIALDRNSITLSVEPATKEGQLARVSLSPPTNWLIIENRICTVKSGQSSWSIWRDPWERVVRIWGQIPINSQTETVRLSVPSVPHYVGETFRSILLELGVRVNGSVKVDTAPEKATLLAETKSPPLSELIRWLNKVSDNLYAEMLLRAVALKETGRGSLTEAMRILEQQMRNWGIEPNDVRLVDGSGLSRLNMVTPRAIVQLLRIAKTRNWFKAFKESLPIAGVDGTLRNRFRGTPAEGKVFAKTGYIGSVVALSGYIQRDGKSELVFSVLVNHYNAPTRQVQEAVDRFVVALLEANR